MNSNTQITRELLSKVKRILAIKEKGRCYCCGQPAHDVAHIMGRASLSTCFDTHEKGNCHLLCRECHTLDHNAKLNPSYAGTYIKRNGSDAYYSLVSRSRQTVVMAKRFIEEEKERLDEEVEHLYR